MQDATTDFEIEVGGRCLMARRFAAPIAPGQRTIVLLHQGLGSLTQWRDFPATLALATGCAVVGYDRQGHGRSAPLDGPRGPDFIEHEAREVLPGVLAALGIARPILYGHSDGGTIALEFAASFPHRPLAVISEAAHVINEVEETGGVAAAQQLFRMTDLRAKLARHHGGNVDAMFHAWAEIWTSASMRHWQMLDRLPAITCPVLVVQGEADEHGTMAQVAAIERGVAGPVSRLLIPGCGHMPHLAASEPVATEVAAFLRRALG